MSLPHSKVALITGASSGIGRATATALVSAGFVTYATARRTETLTGLANQGCHVLHLDVTDEESMVAAVRTVEIKHGAIDVLINNAGYGPLGPLEDMDTRQMRQLFETNVFGLVRLSQLVLPGMRARGRGRIINISSMGGEFTTPFGGAYHASKYAVEAFSDALRFEVRPFGIEVVVVQPGPVKTRMADSAVKSLRIEPDSPYAPRLKSFARVSLESLEKGNGVISAEDVAAVIVKALKSRKPKTRYKVGTIAHMMPFLRHILPDRTWDALLVRMMFST